MYNHVGCSRMSFIIQFFYVKYVMIKRKIVYGGKIDLNTCTYAKIRLLNKE